MRALKNLFSSAVHFFYPHHCIGCGSDLLREKDLVCIRCFDELPFTDYELHAHNPTERIFFGRVNIVAACSGFYFTKGELIQHLIHQLKYNGNTDAGIFLGRLMGEKMQASGRFSDLDHLVPLPLFPEKEFRRGYNQAEVICRGISEAMQVPVLRGNVIRSRSTQTQTRRHRAARWENVAGSFTVKDPAGISGKHILIVDDVITTGATIEACGQAVAAVCDTRISIAALAAASK